MADELYQRAWKVTVDGLEIDDLRVVFAVQKSLAKEPNTAEVTITNCGPSSRKHIEQSRGKELVIEAGYGSTLGIIFRGQVRYASSLREGPNWRTKIESGDGESAYAYAVVSASHAKGAGMAAIIKDVASKLGLPTGNVDKLVANLKKPTAGTGFSSFGRVSDVLDKLLAGQGLGYSIQNGQLQIHQPGVPIDSTAVYLSSSTGLIGSPQAVTPKDTKHPSGYKVTALLQPQIRCGASVVIESDGLKGTFVVQKVEHAGDSHGDQWLSTFEIDAPKVTP